MPSGRLEAEKLIRGNLPEADPIDPNCAAPAFSQPGSGPQKNAPAAASPQKAAATRQKAEHQAIQLRNLIEGNGESLADLAE